MFKPNKQPVSTGQRPAANSLFHAVEICGGAACCAAAQRSAGHRFLSKDSPPVIPLQFCDRPGQCTCRYRHHEDRRAGPRRSVENGRPSLAWRDGERRARRGRRHDD